MHKVRSGEGEYFHIFNRGVEKRKIFLDDKDRWRFMTLLLLSQGNIFFDQTSRLVPLVTRLELDNKFLMDVLRTKYVELVNFCLMPNHFHLILEEKKDKSISKFMQRVADAYTKYFNIRHKRSGHLFGSRFQSRHINSNKYLNYLSAYIHLNPSELRGWRGREVRYPWSSFQDLAIENRWGSFLNSSTLLEQFNDGRDYRNFVEETPAKELEKMVLDI
jgi:putative transposase